jgi:RNA polymerase-binding transcription factor DksA
MNKMKMKKAELKPYKELLLALRQRLRGDVHAMADAALSRSGGNNSGSASSVPSHIADMGSDTFELDNTLALISSEGEALQQVEGALERMEEGVYGSCVECSSRIPKMRLNAIPYTPYCLKCASEIQDGNLS